MQTYNSFGEMHAAQNARDAAYFSNTPKIDVCVNNGLAEWDAYVASLTWEDMMEQEKESPGTFTKEEIQQKWEERAWRKQQEHNEQMETDYRKRSGNY